MVKMLIQSAGYLTDRYNHKVLSVLLVSCQTYFEAKITSIISFPKSAHSFRTILKYNILKMNKQKYVS